jgi:hypothetical protein
VTSSEEMLCICVSMSNLKVKNVKYCSVYFLAGEDNENLLQLLKSKEIRFLSKLDFVCCDSFWLENKIM